MVARKIQTKKAASRVAGPFERRPLPTLQVSPLISPLRKKRVLLNTSLIVPDPNLLCIIYKL